ncbi:MAG: acyltransferase [Bacteroidales bacterium]|nr:acyltransferase [Bacteroidales bacterium]
MERTLAERIFHLRDEAGFEELALETFRFQYARCDVYRHYADGIGHNPERVRSVEEIPFLPIGFFKTQTVYGGDSPAEAVFTSSGTTGMTPSRHHVQSLAIYRRSFRETFRQMVGDPKDFAILALLPSYLERQGSSLLYMVQSLMEESGHPMNRFYLHQLDTLSENLELLAAQGQRTILFGVSFALLDLVEHHRFHLPELMVFETGGMKGRRKELLREELHQRLCEGLGVARIRSEYGMAELLSQAYSDGGELFRCPPWMRVLTRDMYDPLRITHEPGRNGGLNIIDLANLYSCSFIATQDIGRIAPDGRFSVMGRFDQADLRGCNLLVMEE